MKCSGWMTLGMKADEKRICYWWLSGMQKPKYSLKVDFSQIPNENDLQSIVSVYLYILL